MIVVLDIDGTLANNDHRAHHVDRVEGDTRPKDWTAFLEPHLVAQDTVVEGALRAIEHFVKLKYRIVFLTGRNEALRFTTMTWITDNLKLTDVRDDQLIMRPAGNMLKPTEYKGEQITALKREFPRESFLFIDDDAYMHEIYGQHGVCLRAPQCWDSIFPHTPGLGLETNWRK